MDELVESLKEMLDRKDKQLNVLRKELKMCQKNYREQEEEFNGLLELYLKELEGEDDVNGEPNCETNGHDRTFSHTGGKIEKTRKNLEELREDLHKAKKELTLVEEREARIKRALKLTSDADEKTVLEKIQSMKRGKKIAEDNFRKLSNAFADITRERTGLEIRIRELEGEITTMELQKQQSEQNDRRQKRHKELNLLFEKLPRIRVSDQVSDTYPKRVPGGGGGSKRGAGAHHSKEKMATTKPDAATTEPKTRINTQALLSPIAVSERSRPPVPKVQPPSSVQRCVFCGKTFPVESPTGPRFDTHCHIHHHVFKGGSWDCCKGGYDSGGCLRVPHLRIELVGRNQLLLTDGTNIRSMWLSW